MDAQLEYSGPPWAGLGIRPELFSEVFASKPQLGFFEAHSENYFGGSLNRELLLDLAKHYPISLHGVGLSLGRADDLNQQHLKQLQRLIDQVKPLFVSEHLAWSAYSHTHLPDLLPLPLNQTSFAILCKHIEQMQDALGRQVLIENPSNYLLFEELGWPEPEFLNSLAEHTGCGLLVDVNNIMVSAFNVGSDPLQYIHALESDSIKQYHLAGHTAVKREWDGQVTELLIDTHDHTVSDSVWRLFEQTLQYHGPRPTLFEWDSDLPPLAILTNECDKAERMLVKASGAKRSETRLAKPSVKNADLFKTTPQLAHYQSNFLSQILSRSARIECANVAHQPRIAVYQNNVFGAVVDYLSAVYPALQGVLGEGFFKQLCHAYLCKSPPTEGDIHTYGDAIKTQFVKFEALNKMPYLTDLADLEWALHCAYFASVSDQLDPHRVEQAVLLNMPVVLNASVYIIESVYPIQEIHRQSLPSFEGEVAIDLNQGADSILVYKQIGVQSKQLTSHELLFIQTLQKSATIMQAINSLSGSISVEDIAASLSMVLNLGLLTSQNT